MEQKEQINKELERNVSNILRALGISCNLLAYQYLRSTILLCINDCTLINKLTTKLYPTLAKKFDTTPSALSRSIQRTIFMVWQKNDLETINFLLGNTFLTAEPPTCAEFIAIIVEKLRPKQELENKVSNMLLNLGIPCYTLGYKYLQDAIILCMEDFSIAAYITKILYPTLAKKFNVSPKSIERSVKHSIDLGWKRTDLEATSCLFGGRTETPTSAEFIATIADELNLQ